MLIPDLQISVQTRDNSYIVNEVKSDQVFLLIFLARTFVGFALMPSQNGLQIFCENTLEIESAPQFLKKLISDERKLKV